jgi:DNA polymerase I
LPSPNSEYITVDTVEGKNQLNPLNGIIVAPKNRFSAQKSENKVLPLNVKEIRKLFLERKIDMFEATNLLTDWRYFPIRSVCKITNLKTNQHHYNYAVLSKRGNKAAVNKLYKNKTIAPLLEICEKYDRTIKLIDKDNQTHFLKITLTVKLSECSVFEWNGKRCAKEVVLFKKRLRARFGQDLQFARADEVNNNGYIHVNLIVYSPTHKFTVFRHISSHPKYRGRVTWRLGENKYDRDLKNQINSMWVDTSIEENNVDIRALEDCHDLIEYALKYQIKFFKNDAPKRKREWTLGVLTLFNKRSISITTQFTEQVVNYVENLYAASIETEHEDMPQGSARLDTFMSKCPKENQDPQKEENIKIEYQGLVSDYTLQKYGFDTSSSFFKSTQPPPNIRTEANPESKDFSHFPVLNGDLIDTSQFRCIQTIQELADIVDESIKADFIAIDTETTGTDYITDSLVGISFAFGNGGAYYIPISHNKGNIDFELAKPLIHRLLNQDNIKFFHNYKYDLAILHRFGFEVHHEVFDTQIAAHTHDSSKCFPSLELLAKNLLNYAMQSYKALVPKNEFFQDIEISKAAWYSCEDALITLTLGYLLYRLMKQSEVEQSFNRDMQLVPIILDMETSGIRVDIQKTKELSAEYYEEVQSLKKTIYELIGHEINLNSHKQLRELLYTELDLPVKGITKKGEPSVDKYALKSLATYHKIPELILEYRRINNLKNNFLDKIPKEAVNGFIHTQFNLTGTKTGRLSCCKPNMQQIPKRTTADIRSLFLPRDNNHVLIRTDYSQVELRMAAHLSNDSLMVEAYQNGEDIHSVTASKLFDVEIEALTPYQRNIGKTANFGLLYGCGSPSFAKLINNSVPNAKVTPKIAAEYKTNFFKTYHGLVPFFNELIDTARTNGYLVTDFGTRRRFFNLDFLVGFEVEADYRRARNFIIQGACADILKIAMINIYNELKSQSLKSRLILSVHDELVFDVFKPELKTVMSIIKHYMETAAGLKVPLEADISVRKNWAEAVDYE